ncbi:extracellular solute-binding protein [Paenibacillus radicis (ex Xue et al. 2023)]|uniref:Extracellular solute-binding protein n=1 Tax=Paenibacillus radicis (ex Xue et al. 2023) TaxID=2972489 RepID=A0ABT1YBQ5_9BACL|nr:extracellular solute-binding protein [Paenibacillus radicis (ex Xue et al. 2023)]MCR8630626.1 extracellular solute-binding protein [Paenibacillus radicis (ex Xue et al. 2023)]
MNKQKVWASYSAVLVLTGALAGCGGEASKPPAASDSNVDSSKPADISIVLSQVGEVPAKGNDVETAMEKYTNSKITIQWIPGSAYDDKINVMIAAGELPKLVRVKYVPTIISTIQSGVFWEIGPYLKDYKNLSAQNKQHYDNIAVDGKVYGIPLFRDLGRAVIHYRKDWTDALGLQLPKTMDDWYKLAQAFTLNDPDKNGKNDTYGMIFDKKYNDGAESTLTRFSVSIGGPNKWKVENGSFTPEFMTPQFLEAMKLMKRMYADKLINQDFTVLDPTETEKIYNAGRAGIKFSGGNAQNWQDLLVKNVPDAVVDAASVQGPNGIRVPGESGNNGFLAFSKSSIKSEAELKQVLSFVDKLMDPPMATLLMRGIEGRHFVDKGEYTEPLDREANQKEVKPYRDNLPYREGYNVKPTKDAPLSVKNQQVSRENEKYVVANPALTLLSSTYNERGKELELQIMDAQTKFIMGKIDEAGWQAEVDKWKKNGGDKMMEEYKAAYTKAGQK